MKHLAIIVVTILLAGCGTTTVKTGDQIPQEIRETIAAKDKAVIRSMHHGELTLMAPIMSDLLRDAAGEGINRYLEDAQRAVKDTAFSLLNEFYVTYASTELPNTLVSGGSSANDFKFEFKTINKDAYISLILIQGENDQHLVTNIYGDYGGEWKLNTTQFRPYSIGGLTAPEYLKKAESQYGAAQLAPAKISMQLAQLCVKPSGYWTYLSEENIKEFALTVSEEFDAAYSFPIAIGSDSSAQIFQISPQLENDGVVPVIKYVTNISLNDSAAIWGQREHLINVADSIFPGIGEYSLFYLSAYDEKPTGENSPSHIEMASK